MKELNKLKTISSLVLLSVLSANIASAKGVATDEAQLETPTLGEDSAYTLSEGDTGSFVITKYLNEEGFIFKPIEYNLFFN